MYGRVDGVTFLGSQSYKNSIPKKYTKCSKNYISISKRSARQCFIFAMKNMKEVIIKSASENEFETVLRLANSMDLDVEDISCQQFVTAKKENEIIGFGRIRRYPDCTEIATVGVIQPERNKGVGTSIVKELMKGCPKEIYVTCVIPNFFSRLGRSEEHTPELQSPY